MSKPPSSSGPLPAHSALARLQGTLIAGSTLASLTWLVFMWPRSPLVAILVLMLASWSHAAVLALEFLMSAQVNRGDRVTQASATQLFDAWLQESTFTPGIFLWRQPFRWRDLPDSPVNEAAVSPGPAVVFVHGFVCNRGFWAPWMRTLRDSGVPYTSVNLEPVFGSIDKGVVLLEDAVTRAERLGAMPPVLVCHSMGGLAARAWLASAPGNLARVGRVVTIGSPHHGTWLARWSRVTNGRQMQQRSEWLQALAAKEATLYGAQAYANFTCWHSNADQIVFPASTAMLPGADNRHVAGLAHVALGFHPKVMSESLAMVMPAGISSEALTAS